MAAANVFALGIEHRQNWLAASTEVDPETQHSPRNTLELIFSETAEDIEQTQGLDAARRYYRIATSNSLVLSEAVSLWLEEIRGIVTEQTRGHHRAALKLFKEAAPQVFFASDVDRRLAGWFVTNVLSKSGKAPRTCQRILSSLSSSWKWMRRRGFVESNPWEGQGDYRKRQPRRKRLFTPEEITRLFRANPVKILGPRYGSAVVDLQRLGLMTGARLNELCELRAEDVQPDQYTIHIKNGKTANATRVIPVHLSVWPIIEKRLDAASEAKGQLFPELEPQGPDRKRSWYVSKRFTKFRRAVLGDSDEVDFHSLRRCFATYLERAQRISNAVYPSVIDELMGHKKQTLALSLYSGGLRRDDLRLAVEVLSEVIEPDVLASLRSTGEP